ncbi:alkaline phosphatase D family protein [Algibacter pectinivorans]|uniref:Alkaline phosphatase D n=1 Tax=Algibacter pectinivorans TaxID=870482 RepID=A0A1I1M5U2_9FLAO|nr:alkaline phosphatase D family protein [Algibacter pectinivorans]SFC80809.1 alkaline phosphatase D [Algibacter pectinivorans]
MKFVFKCIVLSLFVFSCKSVKHKTAAQVDTSSDFVIAFGSCNKQGIENILWDDILSNKPNLWIWGGDNIYSDTDDRQEMQDDYNQLLKQPEYKKLTQSTKILATWDDHDYGLNDGGAEFKAKQQSQELFLDFLSVPEHDLRRHREGIYHSEVIETEKGAIKIIVLDTRYFRTALTDDDVVAKRYKPNNYGEGTVLGNQQWQWLEKELEATNADFNIIVSSIQFLSAEHGFETWGNFPHEVDKLKQLIKKTQAKGVLLLSGDRHISEFSKTNVDGVNYPLIDFTSSGLTHSYSKFSSEPNPYRIGKVVSQISFGLLKLNFDTKAIKMEMRGNDNIILQELLQKY